METEAIDNQANLVNYDNENEYEIEDLGYESVMLGYQKTQALLFSSFLRRAKVREHIGLQILSWKKVGPEARNKLWDEITVDDFDVDQGIDAMTLVLEREREEKETINQMSSTANSIDTTRYSSPYNIAAAVSSGSAKNPFNPNTFLNYSAGFSVESHPINSSADERRNNCSWKRKILLGAEETTRSIQKILSSHVHIPKENFGVQLKKVEKTSYESMAWASPVSCLILRKSGCEALFSGDTLTRSLQVKPGSINLSFVGYPKETMGYSFYYPPENKVLVARNAEFLENSLITQEAM
ncbi:hypothetical protein Tco_0373284 [Tanacetum coccineum]